MAKLIHTQQQKKGAGMARTGRQGGQMVPAVPFQNGGLLSQARLSPWARPRRRFWAARLQPAHLRVATLARGPLEALRLRRSPVTGTGHCTTVSCFLWARLASLVLPGRICQSDLCRFAVRYSAFVHTPACLPSSDVPETSPLQAGSRKSNAEKMERQMWIGISPRCPAAWRDGSSACGGEIPQLSDEVGFPLSRE